MEVGDGFSAVRAVIYNEAVAAFGDAFFFRYFMGLEQKVPEERGIGCASLGYARKGLFRNDQEVNGCLRVDVAQDDTQIILIEDIRRNGAIDNFFKESRLAGHRWDSFNES